MPDFATIIQRNRVFSGAAAPFASLLSLPASAKTLPRSVFFRMLRMLPPCSNPFLCIQKNTSTLMGAWFLCKTIQKVRNITKTT